MNFSQRVHPINGTPLQLIVEFGSGGSTPEFWSQKHPTAQLSLLTQTHGDALVETTLQEADQVSRRADAQYTEQSNILLGVKTADCIPVLAYHPQGLVAAFHAGWRGVQNQIVPRGFNILNQRFGLLASQWQVWVGPHIQMNSFEIDRELAESFEQQGLNAGLIQSEDWILYKGEKGFVRLSHLLAQELKNIDITPLHISTVDTMTSTNLHSFRREREKGGRQISVIGMLK